MRYLNEKIFELRKKSNLTQEELAEQLQVTRQTISNWESGTVYPSLDKLVELAMMFEVSMDYLVGIDTTSKEEVESSTLLNEYIGKQCILHYRKYYGEEHDEDSILLIESTKHAVEILKCEDEFLYYRDSEEDCTQEKMLPIRHLIYIEEVA